MAINLSGITFGGGAAGGGRKITIEMVPSLPSVDDALTGVIYLVRNGVAEGNQFDEYIVTTVNGDRQWELLGSNVRLDLSKYATEFERVSVESFVKDNIYSNSYASMYDMEADVFGNVKYPTLLSGLNAAGSGYYVDNMTVAFIEGLTSFPVNGTMSYFSNEKCADWLRHFKGITKIPYRAFYSCASLESVTIPENVTNIDFTSFNGCRSLRHVSFNKKLSNIGSTAFNNCDLRVVELPYTMRSIGSQAFAQNKNLGVFICYATTPPSISADIFNGVSPYMKIYVPENAVSKYKAATNWRVFSDRIESIDRFQVGDNMQP